MAVRRVCAVALLWLVPSCGTDAGLSFDNGAVAQAGAPPTIVVRPPPLVTVVSAQEPDAGTAVVEADAGAPPEEVEVFDLESDFVESTCPPVEEEPAPVLQCSPFADPTGCPDGEGCYPLAIYPSDPCVPETFGSECGPEGPGVKGDPCSSDFDCASGFACVVTSLGTQCVALCPRHAESPCEPGLICVAIDVDGFGVCL